eukprot:TRINITY_DN30772_c0_g1_i1.p2 TRINITY_DN30772_c0_g1~~TRINITY_DN30772_c0_g1_i1.p2  ORF type:complete len:249 (-),score=94.77 TRINITY_DN30772_c0_g1_i1:1506-2183(-)
MSEAPKIPKTPAEKLTAKRLIVVLWDANLETVKSGADYQLLNCDDHAGVLKKRKRDPADARPDITHQMLLTLMDSPLNKAGLLQVYVKTANDVLIEINPQTRIPRTFKRFSGLMVQLLHKFSIRASNSSEKLLKVIKNPVTDYLPPNSKKIKTSSQAKKVVEINDYVAANFKDDPVVFVLGAFAHGKIEKADFVDEEISYSNYPLSGSVAAGKLCCAFEKLWGIL